MLQHYVTYIFTYLHIDIFTDLQTGYATTLCNLHIYIFTYLHIYRFTDFHL